MMLQDCVVLLGSVIYVIYSDTIHKHLSPLCQLSSSCLFKKWGTNITGPIKPNHQLGIIHFSRQFIFQLGKGNNIMRSQTNNTVNFSYNKTMSSRITKTMSF